MNINMNKVINKTYQCMKATKLQQIRCAATVSKQTPAEYCLDLVRKNDYENFMCTLILPKNIRSAAFAIRAFNVEVAQVEDQVSDKKIGDMRFQFWMDTLDKIYDKKPPQNPVALELNRILQRHNLSKQYFKRLINARQMRMKNSDFRDLDEIENYADSTVSSIYLLLLEAMNVKQLQADHAASHLGKSQGIATLIRSIPYHAKKRINVLPLNILLENGVSSESVIQGIMTEKLRSSIFNIATSAKLHLSMADQIVGTLDKKISTIFFPIIPVKKYLDELQDYDFDVFASVLQRRNTKLPFQLLWKKYFIG